MAFQGVSLAGCTWAVAFEVRAATGFPLVLPGEAIDATYRLRAARAASCGESSAHPRAHGGRVPGSHIPGAGAATARGTDPGDAGPPELS